MGKCLSKSKGKREQSLNKYFNKLYIEDICFKWNDKRYDRRDAVIEMIHNLSDRIGELDSRLKVQNVILVGSAAEGTQITEADEFDFQFVLQELSQPDSISISKRCVHNDSHVHVTLLDPNLKRKWMPLLLNDKLKCTKGRFVRNRHNGLRTIFYKTLKEAFDGLNKIWTPSGSLYPIHTIRPVRRPIPKHGPAFTPRFVWVDNDHYQLPISVDVCAVIRFHCLLQQIITSDSVTCPTYYNYAEEMGSTMLMPRTRKTSCESFLCFQITFTPAEIMLIMDMSEHHRKCYKLLKYFLNGDSRYPATAFCSYALKTLCINHHYRQECSEETNVAVCLHSILNDMIGICEHAHRTCFAKQMFLSNPFIRTQNIWSHDHNVRENDLENRLLTLRRRLQGKPNRLPCCVRLKVVNSTNCMTNLCNRISKVIYVLFFSALFVAFIWDLHNHSFKDIGDMNKNKTIARW